MSEESTPPKADSSGNDAALAKENSKLAEKVSALEAQLASATKERDAFKTANEQVNGKLTDFDTQIKNLSAQLQAKDGELANWQTQHGQLTAQLGELGNKNAEYATKMSLVEMISSTPEYHPIIGQFGTLAKVIRPDAAKEDIKALLDGQAATVKAAQQSTLDMFKAGGTMPVTGAAQPAQAGPKDVREAWAQLQQLDPRTQQQEYARIKGWIDNFEAARKAQPN